MEERRRWWKGICILGIALAFTLLLTSPALAWWDADWNCRRPITIHSDNALSNYQVLVQLNSTNFDFSKAKPDGSDIRFVDEDDETKLSYWIEEWDSVNESAKIWVKVPSIPTGEETIYLYYNNSGAVSESDGDTVFEFFDDFEDGILGNQWEYHDGCSEDDYYEESDGVGTIHVNHVSGCSSHLYQANYNDTPTLEGDLPDADFELIVVYYNWNPPAGSSPYHEIGIDFIQDSNDFVGHCLGHSSYENKYTRTRFKVDAGTSNRTETARYTRDTKTYRYIKVIRAGDTYHFYYSTDGENWDDEGSETKSGLTKFALSVYVSSGSYSASFDFIHIRKYSEQEPTILIGAEKEYIPPPIDVACASPSTLQVQLFFTEKSGYIFIGTSPDKFSYAYEFHGNGTYTITTTFLQSNKTYYIKACDVDGNCTDVMEFVCSKETELEKKNFTTQFNTLMQGGNLLNISKLGETIPSVYTSLLTDMFWAMFFGGIFLAYWIRQEDVMLPSIVGMISGVAMIGLFPPSAQHIAYILLVISIAGTLYTIIKARR